MPRRPLLLALPVVLACTVGYLAWPSSTPARAATGAESAGTTEPVASPATNAARAPVAVGTRSRYRLVFEHRAAVNGVESAVVEAEGIWTTTRHQGGDVEVALSPERLAFKGDAPPSRDAVSVPFTLKVHDGALLGMAFSEGLPDGARNFLAGVATALQWTDRPGERWTAEEQDLTGKYQATYTRDGQRLRRKRGAYTAMHGAAKPQPMESREDSLFVLDDKGLESATIHLDQKVVMGAGLPTLTISLRARLVRQEVAEVPLVALAEREVQAITPRVDQAAIEQNRRKALVAGARAPELLDGVKSAARPGIETPEQRREASRARRRLTALVELEPAAATEVAKALRQNLGNPEVTGQLSGALASASSPHATNALASLLDEPMSDEARRTVIANLGLAASPTPEGTDALTRALEQPLGGQAALALGAAAHKLGDDATGADAVSTLLKRYEAARSPAEKKTYLEALANTGSRDVLPVMLQAIGGADFSLARVGAFGLRMIPGDDVDDALWSLIAQGSALTLEAVKAAGHREPATWEPRLLKARELYKEEKRVLEAIEAVLIQWANLKIAPKTQD